MSEDLEDAVFRAPPRDFTKARDALAASLKAAGRGAEAKAVKAWRRPALPVWLWNRLILDGDESAREAAEAAAALGEAIALGKGDVGDVINALRAAGAKLLQRARDVAAEVEVGFALAQERELIELVQALPWSPSACEAAARGRLHEAPPPVDPLEAMRVTGGASAPAPKPAAPPEDAAEAQARAARVAAEAAVAKAEAALAQATAEHTTAQRATESARGGLARAEKVLEQAQTREKEAAAEEAALTETVAAARRHRDALV